MTGSNNIVQQIFEAAGVSGWNAIAGFTGGLVNIFVYKKTKPFDAVASLVVGAGTALYVADFISEKAGVPAGLIGFAIGLIGVQGLAPLISIGRDRLNKLATKIGD